MDTRAPAPTPPSERIFALDTIRGCAVLGILLMNILGMGLTGPAYVLPTAEVGGNTGANLWAWIAEMFYFEGTMRGLFTAHFRPAGNVSSTELYVCHGNVIRYLTARALGLDPTAWLSLSVGHASITRIRIAPDGKMQVIAVGDVGHLPPNLQTGASGDAERSLETAALLPAG